jgi:uncharacterized protein (TIGR03435 family)
MRLEQRWGVCAAVAALTAAGIVLGQAARQTDVQSFEVASVKRNNSGEQGGRLQAQPGGRFTAVNATVRQLILRAYAVQDYQIVGAPRWVSSDRFDIEAKAAGDVTPERLSAMLRSLLAERFKLVVHNDTRDLPIYALVPARKDGKLGPRIRQSKIDCDAVAEEAIARGGAPPPVAPGERPPCSIGFGGMGQMAARSKPISQLLPFFSQVTERPVVDRTGLKGSFDIDLTWTPDPSSALFAAAPPDAAPVDPNGPSIFTAVQEQLGLKLESQKAPLPALVIERIEAPTEN